MTTNCNWLIKIVQEKRSQLISAARAANHTIESKTLATIAIKKMTGREVEAAYEETFRRAA
jgi:hypothetical protein